VEFIQNEEPDIKKPVIIAAMQDMGNVGSIVVNFINESLRTKTFRTAKTPFPTYVIDKGGHIDLPDEKWEYRYTEDLIVFGGGKGQPQSKVDIAKKYSAKFIYTLGGFHTNRIFGNEPKTYITTTSRELTKQMEGLNVETTPQKSIITGFNG
jgi:proteasome assembly chaperone (PAC2) family protein